MSLQATLDAGLTDVPDCQAVCCVDFASGIVLAKSLRRPMPQEALDRLAAIGAKVLESAALPATLAALGVQPRAPGLPAFVCVVGRQATLVFARAENVPDQFLCYSCGIGAGFVALSAAIDLNRRQIAQAMQ